MWCVLMEEHEWPFDDGLPQFVKGKQDTGWKDEMHYIGRSSVQNINLQQHTKMLF